MTNVTVYRGPRGLTATVTDRVDIDTVSANAVSRILSGAAQRAAHANGLTSARRYGPVERVGRPFRGVHGNWQEFQAAYDLR